MPVRGPRRRRRAGRTAGVVIAATAALLSIACGRDGSGLPKGEPIPPLALRDYRGRPFDEDTLRGRVVAILFWKVSVEASVAELKGLEELEKTHGERGFEVVGIALDSKDGAYVRNFVQKHRVKIPLLVGNVETAHRFGGLRGVPTLFLFGRDGRLREMFEGFRSNADLEKRVLGLL